MARPRDTRRRQVLGVTGLTVVASGTTALVITMGASQLTPTGEVLGAPYADGTSGGPVVVDETRAPAAPRTPSTPAPTGTVRPGGAFDARPLPAPAGRVTQRAHDEAPAAPVREAPGRAPEFPLPGAEDPAAAPGDPVMPDAPAERPRRPIVPGIPAIANPGDDSEQPAGSDDSGGPAGPGGSSDSGDSRDDEAPAPQADCDFAATELPADAVRRIEEWLCHLTGRPTTVVSPPLKLVPPTTSGPAKRIAPAKPAAARRTAAVRGDSVRTAVGAHRAEHAHATARKAERKAERKAARKAEQRTAARKVERKAEQRTAPRKTERKAVGKVERKVEHRPVEPIRIRIRIALSGAPSTTRVDRAGGGRGDRSGGERREYGRHRHELRADSVHPLEVSWSRYAGRHRSAH